MIPAELAKPEVQFFAHVSYNWESWVYHLIMYSPNPSDSTVTFSKPPYKNSSIYLSWTNKY
jgi:hypothetical protein